MKLIGINKNLNISIEITEAVNISKLIRQLISSNTEKEAFITLNNFATTLHDIITEAQEY